MYGYGNFGGGMFGMPQGYGGGYGGGMGYGRSMGYGGFPGFGQQGMFGMPRSFGAWGGQSFGGLDQRAIDANPAGFARWQQQRDAFNSMGQSGGPSMGAPAVGSPPSAFGKGPMMQPSFSVSEPTPQMVGSPPGAFGKGFVPPQTDGPLTSSNVWRGPPPQGMGSPAIGSPPSAFGFGGPQTGGRQVWNEPQAVGSPAGAFGKGPGFMPQPAQQSVQLGGPGTMPGAPDLSGYQSMRSAANAASGDAGSMPPNMMDRYNAMNAMSGGAQNGAQLGQMNFQNGQAIGSPPGAFGKRLDLPGQQPAFDPYKQFAMGRPGEIPGVSGGGMFGSQPGAGMTGMQNPGPGGAPQAPSGMGGQREAMTDLFAQQANGQPKAAPAGPMWDGFSQIPLTGAAGSMGIDPAQMQQLGFNGLRASLTQDMPGGYSENAKFWVTGADGSNLGSLDMLGRTNGLDLRNLGAGARINWSGLGPQGAVLAGNGRRY